jgi:hypothetical protein
VTGTVGVGITVVGIDSGACPSTIAIFEKPMNRAMPAVSSTISAGEKAASSSARSESSI